MVSAQATAVLTILEARALRTVPDQRAHVVVCIELEVIDGWLRRAATVATADELFID